MGAPYGMMLHVMNKTFSPGSVYYPEYFNKQYFEKFVGFDYTLTGVEMHPISKAFAEDKKAGVDAIKNHTPYLWH